MTPDRRTFLRALLALPIAATFDVEKLLWVPKAIITVPAMPTNDVAELLADLNRVTWQEVRGGVVRDLSDTMRHTALVHYLDQRHPTWRTDPAYAPAEILYPITRQMLNERRL